MRAHRPNLLINNKQPRHVVDPEGAPACPRQYQVRQARGAHPACTGCPSCLSCSLLRRRLASSLIKLAIHLMWCRSKHSAIPRHCYSTLFSGFHTHRRIDELVVHELQSITMHPAPCLNHERLQPRPIRTYVRTYVFCTVNNGLGPKKAFFN